MLHIIFLCHLYIKQCKESDFSQKWCFLMRKKILLAYIRNMLDLCSDSKQGILKCCIYSLEELIFQTLHCKSSSVSGKAGLQHSVCLTVPAGLTESNNLN